MACEYYMYLYFVKMLAFKQWVFYSYLLAVLTLGGMVNLFIVSVAVFENE